MGEKGPLPRSSPRSRRWTALADPNNASRLQHRCGPGRAQRRFRQRNWYGEDSKRSVATRLLQEAPRFSVLGVLARPATKAPRASRQIGASSPSWTRPRSSTAASPSQTAWNSQAAASTVRPPRSPAAARRSIRAFRPTIAAAAAGCAWPVSSVAQLSAGQQARGLVGCRGSCAYSALQLWLARERPKWRRFKGTALMPSRSCRIRPMRRWS